MARKKASGGGGPGSGDWLNTYADMVTLLLTFFILLFSMSSIDAAKFDMIARAFARQGESVDMITIDADVPDPDTYTGSPPEPTETSSEIADIVETIQEMIEQQELQDSVSVSQVGEDVFIRLEDEMLFEPNSAVLRPEHRSVLQFVGESMKSVEPKAKMIAIHGHTAAIPGNPDYAVNDWLLSSARANAVVIFFEEDIGINPIKMQVNTWGKNKPFASNDTEEGRSQNRRIEIHISTESPVADQLDNIYEQLAA